MDASWAPKTLDKSSWPPNYSDVMTWRSNMIGRLAEDIRAARDFNKNKPEDVEAVQPELFVSMWRHYAENPVDFINHWVDTYDPRNVSSQAPTRLPLILFKKQDELVQFLHQLVKDQENGLVDKSRDMGATWVCCAFSVWMWIFMPGTSVGWGSRKQELVDRLGDIDSIFEKLRQIIRGLPTFFLPRNFVYDKHLSFMRILNPETASSITGEMGDNIGRGGRKSMYFKDESAHYEHAELVEAALNDNTRVQVDISTVNGLGTVYDRRRNSAISWLPGKEIKPGFVRMLEMDWSDHPAKTQEWYDQRLAKARREGLVHIFRQEVDRDAAASLVGVIIPADWVNSAVDAHLKLDFRPMGAHCAALDVADEGGDLNALTIRKGPVLLYAEDWSGDEESVGGSTRKTLALCQRYAPMNIQYDCIGIGVGVKSEAARLTKEHKMPRGYQLIPWDAGAAVIESKRHVVPGDKQSPIWEDFAKNLKAQGWWMLRRRFEKTHQMVTEPGVYKYDPSELISLPSRLDNLAQIKRELSQPTVVFDTAMRIKVDKKPDGAKSPNLGDSIMMNYFPLKGAIIISEKDMLWARTGMNVQLVDDDQVNQFT
jgi:hypothetical protein